jgi:probable rRNA maturation factor
MRKKGEGRTSGAKRSFFHLTIHAQLGATFVPYLGKNLRRAHALLAIPLTELSIALVNDRQMSALHEEFLNIAGPTDILTFPLDLNSRKEPVSGELVICVPYARRAAKAHGVAIKNELLLYGIHGMLHLAGFDDRTAAQYNRMHRIEDEILAQLGVGPVFHPSARVGRARGEG